MSISREPSSATGGGGDGGHWGSDVTAGTGGQGGEPGEGGGDAGAPDAFPAECLQVEECPHYECVTVVCTAAHACEYHRRPYGTLADIQVVGDCRQRVCLDALAETVDNTDTPDDLDDCTADACVSGTAVYTPVTPGASCTVGPTCVAGHCT